MPNIPDFWNRRITLVTVPRQQLGLLSSQVLRPQKIFKYKIKINTLEIELR